MRTELPQRLKLIADLAYRYAVDGGKLIDVGSDHGLLSIYCLKNDYFKRAVLTDINEDPAAKSAAAVAGNLLSDRAEVICTDGLDGVSVTPGDVIVMAGLGGNNIRDIIGRYMEQNPSEVSDITFILQPQKSIPELREFLAMNGFVIDDEDYCCEAGFYYCVLCVKYTGTSSELSDREIYYGPVMLGKFDSQAAKYSDYKDFLDRVYSTRARGDKRIAQVLQEIREDNK